MAPTDNSNDITITCPVTNKYLYRTEKGVLEELAPYGKCNVSGQDYHIDALVIDGDIPILPGRYDGYTSAIYFVPAPQ